MPSRVQNFKGALVVAATAVVQTPWQHSTASPPPEQELVGVVAFANATLPPSAVMVQTLQQLSAAHPQPEQVGGSGSICKHRAPTEL